MENPLDLEGRHGPVSRDGRHVHLEGDGERLDLLVHPTFLPLTPLVGPPDTSVVPGFFNCTILLFFVHAFLYIIFIDCQQPFQDSIKAT